MKFISRILSLFLLIPAFAIATWEIQAQDNTAEVPSQINVALASLSQRLREDVTLDSVTSYQWNRQDFGDTSLGCPEPGQFYSQVITPGYQFFITYEGTLYDFRVTEAGDSVILCDTRPAVFPDNPDETPIPAPITCDNQYTVSSGDTLVEIARECNTTVAALMVANPEIEDSSLIYTNQVITIPGENIGRLVTVRPQSGAAGMMVRLFASGFPPGATVEIGFGPPESEYTVVSTREIGDDGELNTLVQIPSNLSVGDERVAVVVLNNQETISEVFTVTSEAVPPTAQPTQPEDGAFFDRTQIYLVALGDDGRSGEAIGCNDSLVPVTVTFESTQAPLTAALTELLTINTRTYGQSGLYNALYQSDLSIDEVTIQNSDAVIRLSGDLIIGGVCDRPRVEAQLRQTALQYRTVDTVTIYLNGELLSDAF